MDDMPELSLSHTIILHQSKAEYLFAAAVFCNHDAARQEVGWLSPEAIKDIRVREFWRTVLGGVDASKAAMDQGIFYELGKYLGQQTFSSLYISSFAETIADDNYLYGIANSLGRLAGLIGERKTAEVQNFLSEISKQQIGGRMTNNTAIDASLDFMASLDNPPTAIKTGIAKIDRNFGGWTLGTLNILGGRPSMGKTAAAMKFAQGCMDEGGFVDYFSIEMTKEQLWSRWICGMAQVDHRKYKRRDFNADEKDRIARANNEIVKKYSKLIEIDDRAAASTKDIWKRVSQDKPDLVIVDHLGLVADQHPNEVTRLGNISWGGKQIAKNFNCASLYLMQLNRDLEKRENKVPTLADIRGSGDIEQNADTVFFIHRPDYFDDKPGPVVSPSEFWCAKDREGPRNVKYSLFYHLMKQDFFETAEEAEKRNE